MTTKLFMGARLRRLREERGLSQAAFAKALQLSPSYLNQLEHDQRPLGRAVLHKITAALAIDPQLFSDEDEARLIADLREALAPRGVEPVPSAAELRAFAAELPGVGRAVVALHARYRDAIERNELLASRVGERDRLGSPSLAPAPYEEVRDFFYARHNYVAELEAEAERIGREAELVAGDAGPALEQRLSRKHHVRVEIVAADPARPTSPRTYARAERSLRLPSQAAPGQRAFQMATQLAFLELSPLLDTLAGQGRLSSDETRALCRIGLASYFAGALLCPYEPFLAAAEALRYDIDRLSAHFGLGFQAICHRLSTLQRPGACGVPFFFIRVDRAGNISKRQSATDFHFSRVGGTCPLWNVYEAFAQPGRILTQLAQMPDGRRYLWIARTVTSGPAGYGATGKLFAIALGCDARHADRLVYSRGLALRDESALTPIGMGCKVCERPACPQRAFPPIGKPLAVDENESRFEPYAVR